MKKTGFFLKEYCQKLSDEHVRFLYGRLSQRLGGDLADAVVFLSQFRDIDRWLNGAEDSEEFYDAIDQIHFAVEKEHERRLKYSEGPPRGNFASSNH